jgi:nucleoside phosphorylase
MKFLVVAAFEPELVRFRQLAADKSAASIAIEAIGVGVVDAAIGMTRCIARHAPTHALLLGTCGGFGVATGEVVTATSVRLVAGELSEIPPPLRVEEKLDVALHDTLVAAGARSVHVANTVGITVDDEEAALVAAATHADVEHLEAFAFARACAAHDIAGAIALGVANAVGSRGRAEWKANHVAMSARAAEVAYAAIAARERSEQGAHAPRTTTKAR